jgi:hypothetical protein
MFEKKIEFWLIFLRKEGNTFFQIIAKRVKTLGNTFTLNKQTYVIDLSKPTYVVNYKRFYLIDYEKGSFYYLEKNVNPLLTPTELDCIISEGLVREITKGIANNPKEKIIWFVMGCLIGALVCYMIASIYFNDKIQLLLENNIIDLPAITLLL